MLCSLLDVKQYLGLETDTNDTLLTALINNVSILIENFTDRKFQLEIYNEIRSGNNKNRIPVLYGPITNLVSVKIDDIDYTSSAMFTETMIYFKNGNTFSNRFMNIELTYEAGFENIPLDVKQVCIELVTYKFKQRDRIGLNSKTLAGEVISYEMKDLNAEVKNILSAYCRVI